MKSTLQTIRIFMIIFLLFSIKRIQSYSHPFLIIGY